MLDDIITTGITINGETRAASNGAVYDLYNPARPSELVGHAAAATHEDVDAAVRAAHAAFPAWAALGFEERAQRLRQIADALTEDENDVHYRSRLFTREHGKIARETLMEMSRLGDRFQQAAGYGERMAVDEPWPAASGTAVRHHHHPPAARCGGIGGAVELAAFDLGCKAAAGAGGR